MVYHLKLLKPTFYMEILPSEMLRRVVRLNLIDVSEVLTVSIIRAMFIEVRTETLRVSYIWVTVSGSQGSSVSIVAGYVLDNRAIELRSPA
jgi:hypothetical protein